MSPHGGLLKKKVCLAKTVQGQERYFDNKSSQPAAVADKKQQEVKVGSKSYEARAKKFDTKVPGATPFQSKLKEYELMAQTVGMFGEISKDGEPILEIAAWKRADEYCTFFAFKPQVDSPHAHPHMPPIGNICAFFSLPLW